MNTNPSQNIGIGHEGQEPSQDRSQQVSGGPGGMPAVGLEAQGASSQGGSSKSKKEKEDQDGQNSHSTDDDNKTSDQ